MRGVVLSTCNRTELYLAADDDDGSPSSADRALLSLAGADGGALAPVLYRLATQSAALHLFRVAAGLDSLVPGEGRSSARCATPSSRAAGPAARPALPAWRSTQAAARASRPRSARARRRCPPPRPRSPAGVRGAEPRVLLVGAGR
jgi:glutamyl-tRNA reductase